MNSFASLSLSRLCLALLATVPAVMAGPGLDLAHQLNDAFAEAVEKASPAVVVITITQTHTFQPADPFIGSSTNSDTQEFWRKFHQQFETDPPDSVQGQGSGVIIRKDGYIVTNRHVVEDASKIEVRLSNGRTFAARVRGVDPQSDIAVIKVEGSDLPTLAFADSDKIRVGEFALAIGAPYSLEHSVTVGHISAIARGNVVPAYMGGQAMDQEFIQTDASINPGNSGGPLIDIEGRVIGINTLIRGMRSGIGFAVPSNLVREVADKLIADGQFARAWLGIGIQALRDAPDFRPFAPELTEGVIVQSIIPRSPAASSELRPADVILGVDGKPVGTPQQLRNAVRATGAGQTAVLDVYRSGERVKVRIKPEEYIQGGASPETAGTAPGNPDTATRDPGFTLSALTQDRADEFGVRKVPGAIVTRIVPNGAAARQGLHEGDIITAVNGKPISNPEEFNAQSKKADSSRGILLNLISGEIKRFVILNGN